jgi:hypothetical protein
VDPATGLAATAPRYVGRDGEATDLAAHAGERDYRPMDWSLVAPHEVPGLWP